MMQVMKRLSCLWIVLFVVVARGQGRGVLIVVGGGATNDAVVARTMELAGGNRAVVAVLPQASAEPDAGDSSVALWKEHGAKVAAKVDFKDRDAARRAIESATLIWMPGGDQNRFMKEISGTGLDELIRTRYTAGAIVGGTSAGAAILSKVMITGEADLKNITAGKTITAEGLGLATDVIFDQHFLQRQRGNRLISAVLDHRSLVGIGIDESTAVIMRGSDIEVVGKSAVVVIDARHASIPTAAAGAVDAGTGLALHVLRSGMSMNLAR
jgi:cyanophycinase